jgi:hypothetical protein
MFAGLMTSLWLYIIIPRTTTSTGLADENVWKGQAVLRTFVNQVRQMRLRISIEYHNHHSPHPHQHIPLKSASTPRHAPLLTNHHGHHLTAPHRFQTPLHCIALGHGAIEPTTRCVAHDHSHISSHRSSTTRPAPIHLSHSFPIHDMTHRARCCGPAVQLHTHNPHTHSSASRTLHGSLSAVCLAEASEYSSPDGHLATVDAVQRRAVGAGGRVVLWLWMDVSMSWDCDVREGAYL